MRFVAIGLSHHTAPIELRERFAQHTSDLSRALKELEELEFIHEACIVSTCNRVEFYVSGNAEAQTLGRAVSRYVQSFSGLPPEKLTPHLYQHEGVAGIRHLFRVASSLDSMVLGEPQILGQVKLAYRKALEHGAIGSTLTKIFEKSFTVAKRVRTETGVADNAVSMSFAAVELGREIFDTLEGKNVLMIGAGEMATLAAKHLKDYRVAQVRVASRTIKTAERLAKEIGGMPSTMADLPLLLGEADIVISSTAAPGYVVEKKMMGKVVRKRRYRPILFVDIAVPRDIHPKVADLDNVFVYDVDDLQSVLELNRENRAKEAAAAHELIDEEIHAYVRWMKSQQVVPIIKALREHAVSIAQSEAERTLSNIKETDKKIQHSIRKMSQSIVNKTLHPVLTRLKEEGASGDPQQLIDTLVSLFDLDPSVHEPEASTDEKEDDEDNVVQFRQREQG